MTKVLYTADLHGNEIQYDKLVSRAIETHADVVIIGGDLAPKGRPFDSTYVEKQRKFLEERLPKIFEKLRSKSPDTKVFIMMGNDDCASHLHVLEKHADMYTIIHNNRINLHDNYDIIGYSIVPITPFGSTKDWEKYDMSDISETDAEEYEERKKSGYNLQGLKSTESDLVDFSFDPTTEAIDSIQKDLTDSVFTKNPEKTVYITHSPPHDTCLDQIEGGIHVGSFAVREFIETHQPYLTLHGHIHETVDISGEFTQQIGKTVSASPGNHNIGETLCILEFELEDLSTLQRHML